MSEDETRRDRLATDEGDEGKEDVEAHRHAPRDDESGRDRLATDEGEGDDDVEAHRQHGGSGRQHGGA